MELEVSYSLDNEQQFWDEIDDIVSTKCQTHELIDNALRSYLHFTTTYKAGEYLHTDHDVARCSYKLLESPLFEAHKDYVRHQIIYCLLQEDSPDILHFVTAFLLFDGKQNEGTFEVMNDEGAFPRLLELIQSAEEQDAGLHRTLLQLFFEMSRIQRIRNQELMLIEDDFVIHLFQIIEGLADDVSDPYHYPIIRALLVLNEQYMISAHDPGPGHGTSKPAPIPNKVLSTLSTHGAHFKTFGENIILLLNRESETSLQLLILKVLYLLFTTKATHEYFYTNDLRVLVDVMLRNLLDLPFSAKALRHTYLRVLYPLLAHTQLNLPENHYKKEEILKVLHMMVGGGAGLTHFGAVDETTKRLAARCAQVGWLGAAEGRGGGGGGGGGDGSGERNIASKLLTIGMNAKAGESSLSVVGDQVAATIAKPGEQAPSLGTKFGDGARGGGGLEEGGVPLGNGNGNGNANGNGTEHGGC
ncbi:MAG: hypothetical protein LQ340_001991 [Diploschistes diacapsis]|nr:MAG: hypothetical protein LQ340_001991 [Diploschistes diacapsis]